MVVQYGLFVKRLFLGDEYGWPGLGFSFNTRSALRPIIFDRMLITIQLALGAAVLWLMIGIPIGILSALRPRSLFDRAAMGFALIRRLGAGVLRRTGGALHLLVQARLVTGDRVLLDRQVRARRVVHRT